MSASDQFTEIIKEQLFRDQMAHIEPLVHPEAKRLIESGFLDWLRLVERKMNPALNQFFVCATNELRVTFPMLDTPQISMAAMMLGWWLCLQAQNGNLDIPDEGVSKEMADESSWVLA